jgi:crossover junction endodeoxyribonuclease RuvC
MTPNEVKMSITGYGGATKEQVIYMVTKILNLAEPPKPDDVADALAIGIGAAYEANSLARRNLF